ncbi:hypothetical protein ACWPNZ_14495, partial [Corynebacterium striatum]
ISGGKTGYRAATATPVPGTALPVPKTSPRQSGKDEVFFNLVQARIISPGSKFDSIETLAEVGVASASYATIKRYLPRYADK